MLDQFLRKHLGILRGCRLTFGLLSGDDIEFDDRMQLVGGRFSRLISLALLGHHMDQDRTIADLACILQYGNKRVEIVPVNRADIVETQFLEERPAGDHPTGEFLSLPRGFLQGFGQGTCHRLAYLAQGLIAAP